MRRHRLAVLAMVALVPTAAIRLLGGSPSPAAAQVDQEAARGFELYVAGCASCHGVAGQGTGQGPPLVGVGAAAVDFMLSTGRMPLSDPASQPVRSPPEYSPEEIAAVVAYVGSLGPGGPAIPLVVAENGDLSRGRALYSANCLACHKDVGWLIERKRGFHATVTEQSCASCHPDHAGTSFDLIRWPDADAQRFDHTRAGWALRDKHATTKCEACHATRYRLSPAAGLAARKTGAGWTGLEQASVGCHADPHRNPLGR